MTQHENNGYDVMLLALIQKHWYHVLSNRFEDFLID